MSATVTRSSCTESTPTARRRAPSPDAGFRVTLRASGDPGQSCVEAWLEVHGLDDGVCCLVVADGFDDRFHFGRAAIRCLFCPDRPGRWQALPGTWRCAISSWRGPDEEAHAAADWMATRFMGIRVRTRIVEDHNTGRPA